MELILVTIKTGEIGAEMVEEMEVECPECGSICTKGNDGYRPLDCTACSDNKPQRQRIAALEAAGLGVVLECGGLLPGEPISESLLAAVNKVAALLPFSKSQCKRLKAQRGR